MRGSMVQTEFRLTLSRTSGRDHDRDWSLRVTDDRSGKQVLEVELNAETFSDLMSARQTGNLAVGEMLANVENVGRYAIHASREHSVRGIGYDDIGEECRQEARAKLAHDPELKGQGWTYTGFSGGGGGSGRRTLNFVRYVDEEPDGYYR